MQRIIYLILIVFSAFPLLALEEIKSDQLESYFEKANTSYYTRCRFYTYLYVAQNAALNFCEEVQDYIKKQLINRFFSDFNEPSSKVPGDLRLTALANEILCPYFVRMSLEDASEAVFTSNCWRQKIPETTRQIARWIPWAIPLPQPPPPFAYQEGCGWAKQFSLLKKLRHPLSDTQKQIVKKWGETGKEGIWYMLANRYMEEKNTPYATTLLVRAALAMGIYDGLIAEMTAKYTYCVPRPFMMDPSFTSLIPDLTSPSYPSGHAIIGTVCATILAFFFPEDHLYWYNLDVENKNSRLWAGVHFCEDIEQGTILGKKIAEQILQLIIEKSSFILFKYTNP